jgi:hypothetical protein
VSEWQPIETAPKDGRTVLVWVGWVQTAKWDGDGWADNYEGEELPEPTDWMPTPDPPKAPPA